MAAPLALTLQFLAWVAVEPRPYAEVMEAWRTSCPRLSVWEDALLDGLVRYDAGNAVCLTPRGRALLAAESPAERGKPSRETPARPPRRVGHVPIRHSRDSRSGVGKFASSHGT